MGPDKWYPFKQVIHLSGLKCVYCVLQRASGKVPGERVYNYTMRAGRMWQLCHPRCTQAEARYAAAAAAACVM